MDGKADAEAQLNQALKDPALLRSLIESPRPADA